MSRPKRRSQANKSRYAQQSAFPGLQHYFMNMVKLTGFICLILFVIVFAYFATSIFLQVKDLPDVGSLERYEPIEAIRVFDRNDHLICMVEGDEDRQIIPLNQISQPMQQAMLAAEDHHFFEHHGVDFAGIIRALLANVQAGHVVEGGSTITQQLVKNLFFSQSGRTFDRKFREAVLAFELERRYSKEKILELYLNQIYFGSNAYGIERAAARYFNKTAAQLNLAESAFLAGLVKAPSELGTPHNRPQAIARQHEILNKMCEYGYITPSQKKAALATKLAFHNGANPFSKYPYYVSYVLQLLHEKFSENEIRKQGLKVYTNLDPKTEQIAEDTLNEAIRHAPKGVSQSALVSISVHDGSVLALVGGVGDFWKNQFNRAVNPHTVGSSFKPFVYLTAFLNNAATPDSTIDDSPFVVHQGWGLPDYIPKNFDHKFYGRITVRRALALSRNIPALRMAQRVGIDKVIETARLAGITSKLDPNLSLALGSSAVSPLDMASAYSTFARGGVSIKPVVIRYVENNRGQVIDSSHDTKTKVFPPEPVAELLDVLQDVVKYGTGTQAKLADRPVAGKTGTADEGKDIWFIGFTPDLVTAVWGGNDENLPIPGHNVTGGVVMAKIWHQYNDAYYKAYPTQAGSFPAYDYKLAAEKMAEKAKEAAQKATEQATPNTYIKQPENADSLTFTQPKVEEIEAPKENTTTNNSPEQNISDKSTTVETINSSDMPPTAPPIQTVPSSPASSVSPAPAGTAPAPTPTTRLVPEPGTVSPYKPATTTPLPAPAQPETGKRLYPYSYGTPHKVNF